MLLKETPMLTHDVPPNYEDFPASNYQLIRRSDKENFVLLV